MLFGLLKNLLIVFILAGLLIVATKFIPKLKNQTQFSNPDSIGAKVLGAKTASTSAQPLSESLKKDTSEQLDQVKKQALKVNIGDVLNTVGRLQKIPHDISSLEKGVVEQVQSLVGKK